MRFVSCPLEAIFNNNNHKNPKNYHVCWLDEEDLQEVRLLCNKQRSHLFEDLEM